MVAIIATKVYTVQFARQNCPLDFYFWSVPAMGFIKGLSSLCSSFSLIVPSSCSTYSF